MKKLILTLCIFINSITVSVAADALVPNKAYSTWELMGSLSYFKYTETVNSFFFIRDEGVMLGVFGAWTYHNPDSFIAKVDATLQGGNLNYKSFQPATIEGDRNYLFEIRAVMGPDFYINDHQINPYVGLGYRYLDDELGGKVTTLGAVGYIRRANYYYSPVGITINFKDNKDYKLDLIMEYDLFWQGIQKSYLDADPLINEQTAGYGFRTSLRFEIPLKGPKPLLVEPYYKHWDINASTFNCNLAGTCGVEPDNITREVGIKLGTYL